MEQTQFGVNHPIIRGCGPTGELIGAGGARLPKRGGTKPIRLPARVEPWPGCGKDRCRGNKANRTGVTEQSQSEYSAGAGECSISSSNTQLCRQRPRLARGEWIRLSELI